MLSSFLRMPNNLFCLFKPNSVFSSQNNRNVDLLWRHYTWVMGVRIRFLLLYWLDKEGKSKENQINKMCQSPQIFLLCPKKLFIFRIFSSLFVLLALKNLVKSPPLSMPQFIIFNNKLGTIWRFRLWNYLIY